ncbi:MAG: hypothetical protein HUK24_01075 [Sphaerochaetaceae bacterium]|nr:hypothetical protein [Sphaerochaetaceae bacterium]
MAGVNTDIELMKKDIQRCKEDLDRSFMELGQVAAPWHEAINYVPSRNAFENLCAAAREKELIESSVEKLQEALASMSQGDREIKKTKTTMKDLDTRLDVLISSLGAVAIEASAAGNLPERLSRFLSPMEEYDKKLESLNKKLLKLGPDGSPLLVSIWERKIDKHKKTLDNVFIQTGKKLYASGDFRLVPGERAKVILDEMEELRLLRKNLKNNIQDQRTLKTQAQSSLENMGALGEENRRLRELKQQDRAITETLNQRYIEYGRILSEGVAAWIDEKAPEDLQFRCREVFRFSDDLRQREITLENLYIERDMEIHNLQVSKLTEQVTHLNSQIQAIESQKRELQQKIDVELKAVSDLKMKQSKLNLR